MKNMKTSILTLAFLSVSGFAALSMEGDTQEDNSNSKKIPIALKSEKPSSQSGIKVKTVTIEEFGFDDKATTLDENASSFVLINKDSSQFEKRIKIIKEAETGEITVITPYVKGGSNLLESKRFFVKEGDKIQVSYKVHIHPGDDVRMALSNTQRNGYYGNIISLSTGEMMKELNFKRIVPKDETETSLVFYITGSKETPGHSSFTIEGIGINKM